MPQKDFCNTIPPGADVISWASQVRKVPTADITTRIAPALARMAPGDVGELALEGHGRRPAVGPLPFGCPIQSVFNNEKSSPQRPG